MAITTAEVKTTTRRAAGISLWDYPWLNPKLLIGATLVVLIILMLAGLSAAFLQESLAENRSVQQRRANVTALEICEMGIAKATLEIYAMKDAGADGIGAVSGQYASGTYHVTSVQHPTSPDRW